MTATAPAPGRTASPLVRGLDVFVKVALLVMLGLALVFPDYGNLEGKAAGLRAVGYPLLAFAIPIAWLVQRRDPAAYPWGADVLVSLTCFSDILGNRFDLYDAVVWFDDWMHVMNTGLLAAALILLTMDRTVGLGAMLERALACGATAAVAWEIAEFYAFIHGSSERQHAYSDTLGDLGLGILGAVTAALVVRTSWRRRGDVPTTPQQLEARYSAT
jgi:hypothetical protein